MKIDKINIIRICNYQHSDFGLFAKFLDGLSEGESIEVPQNELCYLCEECARPLWKKDVPCLFCMGVEKGKESVVDIFKDHTHTWTAEESPICINCGILKSFLNAPSRQKESNL